MPESKNKKPRRTSTADFKSQIVQLYQNGKRKSDIIKEYDISPSLLDKLINHAGTTGSFNEKDNRTPEEQELIELRKRKHDEGILEENILDVFKASRPLSVGLLSNGGMYNEQNYVFYYNIGIIAFRL